MLERMGVEDAQSWSSGDLVELANLIAERRRGGLSDWGARCLEVFGMLAGLAGYTFGDKVDPDEVYRRIAALLPPRDGPFSKAAESASLKGLTASIWRQADVESASGQQAPTRASPAATVRLEDVQDPNFCGGLGPVEYLDRLHNGEAP